MLGTMVMPATTAGRPSHGHDVPGPFRDPHASQNFIAAFRFAEHVRASFKSERSSARISAISASSAGRRFSNASGLECFRIGKGIDRMILAFRI